MSYYGPRARKLRGGGFLLILPWLDALVLRGLPARLYALLSDPAANARIVGRLFPKAYEDPVQEAEYRKLVGEDLRKRKLESAASFRKSLEEAKIGDSILISKRDKYTVPNLALDVAVQVPAEGVDDWLCFINDMRLVLATGGDEDDPLLHYLGWIEETVVEALSR